MFWLSLIFIVGINLAPLAFFHLTIWEAQGLWTQIMTLALFSWSFIEKPKNDVINWPLAVFLFWAGTSTIFYCYTRNNILNFLPFLNILCGVILFNSFSKYLDEGDFELLIDALRWVVLVTAFMCVLQYFGYAQFFRMLFPDSRYFNNQVVGFIGQPTHLAGYLGMLFPVFLYKLNREKILSLILLSVILLFFTGTTKNDPAASGVIVAIVASVYFSFKTSLKSFLITIGISAFLFIVALLFSHHGSFSNYLDPKGRFLIWSYYLELSKTFAITGTGLGTVKAIFQTTPYPTAMHTHLEYLHVLFELGIIGLMGFILMIEKFLRIKVSGCGIVLQSIVVGFLASCCFNYPAHLWLSSTYAIFAYAGVYALKEN